VKTLAIRLEDDVSAQLTILAQLEATSVTDLIRSAITELIGRKKSEGNLAARADAAIAELEADARARRLAIQALFGPSDPPASAADVVSAEAAEMDPEAEVAEPPSRSRRKSTGGTS